MSATVTDEDASAASENLAARRRRAVVLVGGPVAPYSRAIRIARALAAEGCDVEIAAIAAAGLPEEEEIAPGRPATTGEPPVEAADAGRIVLRRYRSSGPWALLGTSNAVEAARAGIGGPSRTMARRAVSRALRRLADPLIDLRRWLFWPHAVRGWWSTLSRDLAPADLYHACGALAIQPALAARRRHPIGPAGGPVGVIYDSVDIAGASNSVTAMPPLIQRRIRRREAGWARDADRILAVSESSADRLTSVWHPRDAVVVIPNVPEPPPATLPGGPRPEHLRHAAGLAPATRLVVFQGRTGPDLGLESAAEAVTLVPNAALVILGFGRGMAISRARDRDARFAGRHVTLDARPVDEVVEWVASADVCLIPLPPVSVNQRLTTPNKLWEAVVAGTPVVVVAGLTSMERLVREHDLGAVAADPSPEALATAINGVLERLRSPDGPAWRERIAALGRGPLGWPGAASRYRAVVRPLLGG